MLTAPLAVLERLSQGRGDGGRLLAFDQDSDAIERAMADDSLSGNPRLTLVHGNFRYLRNFLRFYGAGKVDGILADLGVSFHHFDDPDRGFSFRWEGALDMRMNREAHRDASKLITEAPESELADIFHLYGELRQARKLASAIAKARKDAPITTVPRLLEVIKPFINPKQEKKELAQVFQALRIEVNNEIEALKQLLTQAREALKPGGRLAVITYHSLEDRLVKNFMKTGNLEGKEAKDSEGIFRTQPLPLPTADLQTGHPFSRRGGTEPTVAQRKAPHSRKNRNRRELKNLISATADNRWEKHNRQQKRSAKTWKRATASCCGHSTGA